MHTPVSASVVRFAIAALALASSARALQGIVLDTAGHPIQGVEVRPSWSAEPDTTDPAGVWSIADAAASGKRSDAEWSWSGSRLDICLDAAAKLRLDAFDPSGRRLWASSVDGVAGWNRIAVPDRVDGLASVLRVQSSAGTMRFLRRGSATPTIGASRSSASMRVLSFRRTGYYDLFREIAEGQDTVLAIMQKAPDTTGKVARVVVSPDTGVHTTLPQVSFACATPGVTFFYTLDSTAPSWDTATLMARSASTRTWTIGSSPIDMQRSVWLRVAAGRHGMRPSDTLTGRYVYIGDSALIDNFEGTGFGSMYGAAGLSWFACQYMNGMGCDQDQKFQLERTLPRLDTSAADYNKVLGARAWRVQVSIAQKGEDDHPGYAGCAIRVPSGYPDAAYRLVFWAKFQDTGSSIARANMPLIVEMALKGNAQNNGGYQDGFHRKALVVDRYWKRYEIDFSQFYGAGNAFATASLQPDSTLGMPRYPAIFREDPAMPGLGLSGYQGSMTHGNFAPAWTWNVSKETSFAKSDVVGFRFSVMQPMDSVGAASVGSGTDSVINAAFGDHAHWKDPREPAYTQTQLASLVKGIRGYLWIDDVRLVRKAI